MSTFAERLKKAQTRAGMTQKELAEKSGCSTAAISQYLSGINYPTPARMHALAKATGTTIRYLEGDGREGRRPKRINVSDAARCLGKSQQFVRDALIHGVLPIGCAVPGQGTRWNFYINPIKLKEYVGEETFARCITQWQEKQD